MKTGSVLHFLVPLILASQEAAGVNVQPSQGGAAVARTYMGAMVAFAAPVLGKPVEVGARVELRRDEQDGDGPAKRKDESTTTSEPIPEPMPEPKKPLPLRAFLANLNLTGPRPRYLVNRTEPNAPFKANLTEIVGN